MPGGLSSARLARLRVNVPSEGGRRAAANRVVKYRGPAEGWLEVASEDSRLREVRLWERGLLADLPAGIGTGVLAWAVRGPAADAPGDAPSGAALLMRNERAHLLRRPLRSVLGRRPPMLAALLERLARMHARFWGDPRLGDPALGLMPARAALLLTAPATVARRIAAGDDLFYLPMAVAGWEAFFALAGGAAARLRAVLDDPDSYARAIAALPATLVHGDVWGPNLGWLPPTRRAPRAGRRLLLLDWALATAGPATYDPLWLCGTWHALDPVRVLAAYRARLERHLRARGHALPAVTWRALADASYLRTALTCGEALGRAAVEASPGAARARAEARARWWAARAARAAERLVPRG